MENGKLKNEKLGKWENGNVWKNDKLQNGKKLENGKNDKPYGTIWYHMVP